MGRAGAWIVVLVCALALPGVSAIAWDPPAAVELLLAEDVFARVNAEREARQLPLLRWDPALAQVAADWSQQMAATGRFEHRPLAAVLEAFPHLAAVGENIAWGRGSIGAGSLHLSLMRSSGHRANLLAEGFDAIGVGVRCSADGAIWLTENFGRTLGSGLPGLATFTPPEEPIARTDSGPGCDPASHGSPLPAPRLEHAPGLTVTAACPADVPRAGFPDTVGNPHERAIDCAVWWRLASGTTAGTFDPAVPVTRGQMARFLANLLDGADVRLPAPLPQGFLDVSGSVHADAINQLAALGVVAGTTPLSYQPGAPVRRDQMAAFLVRAYELAAGSVLPAPPAPFTDHLTSTHRSSIEKAAAAGFTAGTAPTAFSPAAPVRRDQMARFLTRVLDRLVTEGHVRG